MAKQAVLTEYRMSSSKLKQPLTIAHVSDLHEQQADDIASLVKQLQPDLIAISGDSFERYERGKKDRSFRKKRGPFFYLVLAAANLFSGILTLFGYKVKPREIESLCAFLESVTSVAPVVMSLGNHEENLYEEDYAILERYGVTLLDNADTTICVNGNKLRVGGLSTNADDDWLASFAQKDGFKLLLSHHPDYYDEKPLCREMDLVLSGHNHGGQIKLFGHGVFSSGSGIFPEYDSGMFHNRLIVSAGCSNTFAVPRWGNPRELVAVYLEPEKELNSPAAS